MGLVALESPAQKKKMGVAHGVKIESLIFEFWYDPHATSWFLVCDIFGPRSLELAWAIPGGRNTSLRGLRQSACPVRCSLLKQLYLFNRKFSKFASSHRKQLKWSFFMLAKYPQIWAYHVQNFYGARGTRIPLTKNGGGTGGPEGVKKFFFCKIISAPIGITSQSFRKLAALQPTKMGAQVFWKGQKMHTVILLLHLLYIYMKLKEILYNNTCVQHTHCE